MVLCIYAEKISTLCSATRGYLSTTAKGFNRDIVLHFFDMSESSIAKFRLTSDKICNVDERGFSNVQKRPYKIVAQKGKHQVGIFASLERGVNTTVVAQSVL
jgi:hypothetical protein